MKKTYIKFCKMFNDGRCNYSEWIFYIEEDLFATDTHPYRFAHWHLLALSTVALKDGKIEKCRFHSNEDLFDSIMLGVGNERMA